MKFWIFVHAGIFAYLMACIYSASPCFAAANVSDKNDRLIQAVQNGNLAITKNLLAAGANINARDASYGLTVLMWAADYGHTKVAKLLLEKGAEIDAKDNKGQTALMIAADALGKDLVISKSRKGTDGKIDWVERTVESVVIDKGRIEIINILLKNGAKVNDRDNSGYTALMLVSDNNQAKQAILVKAAELLLEKGADVNINKGRTALMMAEFRGHQDIVKLLEKAGARHPGKDEFGGSSFDYQSERIKAEEDRLRRQMKETEEEIKRLKEDIDRNEKRQAEDPKFKRAQESIDYLWDFGIQGVVCKDDYSSLAECFKGMFVPLISREECLEYLKSGGYEDPCPALRRVK